MLLVQLYRAKCSCIPDDLLRRPALWGAGVQELSEGLRYVSAVLFSALMVLALREWLRTRRSTSAAGAAAAKWFFLTFLILAVTAVAALALPDDPDAHVNQALTKAVVLALVVFPYCLYRFGSVFSRPSRIVARLALALTTGMSIWTLLLPAFPGADAPQPRWLVTWIIGFLVHWSLLSIIVAYRLWRAGSGQPGVVRSRMRLLAAGSLLLTISLLISGFSGSDPGSGITIVARLVGEGAAVAYLLGFSPPAVLRLIWRRHEQNAIRESVARLLTTMSEEAIASQVLPNAASVVGGTGAVLIGDEGAVNARFQVHEADARAIGHALLSRTDGVYDDYGFLRDDQMFVRYRNGWLVTVVPPFVSFFGIDEVRLLRSIINFMDMALDRLRLEASLRGTQDKARTILETAHEAFVEMDEHGVIADWNAEAARTFGWSKQEVLGKRVADVLVPPAFRDAHTSGLERFLATGEGPVLGRRIELTALHRDGHEFPVELTITPLKIGDVHTFHAFLHDITDRREVELAKVRLAENLEQANAKLMHLNELRSHFLAIASHELRTPLTAISGFSSTMMAMWDTLGEAEKREFVQIIDEQSQRLSRLVDDLLTSSKIESGSLKTNPQPIPVRERVEQTLRELDATHVDVQCPDELAVLADVDHFQQIIVNYVTNAMRHGGDPILVHGEDDGSRVRIRVIDHGDGVPPEFVPYLYEPFAQAEHAPRGDDGKGTGLGLSIVRGLAEAQGGATWYEPHPAGGSCFTIELPRAQVPARVD